MQNLNRMVVSIRGFTIIELMVVVTIISTFALIAAPYTATWRQDADVRTAASTLELAYGKAKALALRNPAQAYETSAGAKEIASGIKIENSTLLVCKGAPTSADCVSDGDAVAWSGVLPNGVDVTVNNLQISSYGLDNTGQSIKSDGDPIRLTYIASKGARSHEEDLR